MKMGRSSDGTPFLFGSDDEEVVVGELVGALVPIENVVGVVSRDDVVPDIALDIGCTLPMHIGQGEILHTWFKPVSIPDWVIPLFGHCARALT
jgi:hypothetical protein